MMSGLTYHTYHIIIHKQKFFSAGMLRFKRNRYETWRGEEEKKTYDHIVVEE